MICRVSIFPFTLSNSRPARIATVAAGGGQGMMPPQGSTQGVTDPWDFQAPGYLAGGGVSGAWPAAEACASTRVGPPRTTRFTNTAVSTKLNRMTKPFCAVKNFEILG